MCHDTTTKRLFARASSYLDATVPASIIASPGAAGVTVYNPGVGTSLLVTFTIQSKDGIRGAAKYRHLDAFFNDDSGIQEYVP